MDRKYRKERGPARFTLAAKKGAMHEKIGSRFGMLIRHKTARGHCGESEISPNPSPGGVLTHAGSVRKRREANGPGTIRAGLPLQSLSPRVAGAPEPRQPAGRPTNRRGVWPRVWNGFRRREAATRERRAGRPGGGLQSPSGEEAVAGCTRPGRAGRESGMGFQRAACAQDARSPTGM